MFMILIKAMEILRGQPGNMCGLASRVNIIPATFHPSVFSPKRAFARLGGEKKYPAMHRALVLILPVVFHCRYVVRICSQVLQVI